MDILKRLIQAIQWLAFLFIIISALIVAGMGLEGHWNDETLSYVGVLIPYMIIVVIRWILFKEWIYLPWQKGAAKED